ncbi:MAG: hypothetical protein C0519_16400 [Hyphomicrobium sp.]|nr:hypothetical protein [Hyphomicrobium sp.]
MSRRNALKHGLTARSLVIEGEHPKQFEELRTELIHAYTPQGIVEEQLVDMMAGLLWRLRRVPALEAATFAWMQRCHRPHDLAETQTDGLHRVKGKARHKKQSLGRAVFHLVRDGDLLDKLNRYESHLMMQLGRVAAALEHQQGPKATPSLTRPALE